ncbi:G1 S-specific cyclin pas1 [Lecanosticta acicola]|uniref:G1 S-specific cyclin pas1 n=1 Tax=Lecanosticta acicola TaxID=111012 RepID=A0AAI8YUH8_9PEZI|nr:G1 S-specific cyclin pas1 [Lecanosticta acicola]
MNLDLDHNTADGYGPSSGPSGPYEPSVASTASSSQASVFSDTLSAQSSIATSFSDDFRSSQEEAHRDRICAKAQLRSQAQNNCLQTGESLTLDKYLRGGAACPSYADVTSVPGPQRQHPRRCSLPKNHKPPPLVRQRDRKINFVDNLVDSATQMVEVIWPLSVVPCRGEGNGRGVLPLRTYIEETLRRSRTSYSTLQVALYYLILIRPHVPKSDFTMEQTLEVPSDRALMCGRRMFLAALILASKYLQDRNYSAKAWSKMSGLRVCEINTNERTFLNKINWRLHISKPTFEKWQEVVLRFSPTPPSPGQSILTASTWKRMVPILTPELDNVPLTEAHPRPQQSPEMYHLASPATPTPTRSLLKPYLESTSQEGTPTPTSMLPRFLEPRPDIQPPTPALARMGPLPTPNMTPSTIGASTPAASACGSRRPSISGAMALAQKTGFNRCAYDTCPPSHENGPSLARRPSIMSMTSSGSSPESLMSDNSRSSRSSSVSSISTVSTNSSMALQRACLARQATCRNAGLPSLKLVKEEREGSAAKPIILDDDMEIVSSPFMTDFSVSGKALNAPHRHSRSAKHASQPAPMSTSAEKSRKRGRSSGHRRSELQEEVRYLLEEHLEDDFMDVDDHAASPSDAATYASNMLARDYSPVKEAQLHNRRESSRVPVQKNEGRKRTCCSASSMSISPVPLYGEVV